MPFEVFPYTNFHELNLDWIVKTCTELKDKTDDIDVAVAESQAAAAAALASENAIKDIFATPEMFGGVGDGITDDRKAIQDAIDSGKPVLLTNKTYKIDSNINLSDKPFINLGLIKYDGQGYAVQLMPEAAVQNISYHLGNITADNGGCFKIDSTSAFVQYINIYFEMLRANDQANCIYLNVNQNYWINEIRFNDGRFGKGLNGIYINRPFNNQTYTSHIIMNKVGFEGVTNGVNIPEYINALVFTDCRAEESITNIVLSRTNNFNQRQVIIWNGSIANELYWKNCTNYIILFDSGILSERGTLVSTYPIIYYNGNTHGLNYNQGFISNVNDYGAYQYDSGNTTQETNFKTVYDYSTQNQYLWNRPFGRYWLIPNEPSATATNVYLDDRMFLPLDINAKNNSYLLEMTLSPNDVLHIYNKQNGTLIYSETNGATTVYNKYTVTKSGTTFYIEKVNVTRKNV